jgi:hypothetical protein
MRRWRRAAAIAWRLTPFLVAFLRDRRRWILVGVPAGPGAAGAIRRSVPRRRGRARQARFPNHHVRALTSVVREFSVRVREEMDFRQEARHIELFHRHFSQDRRVRAPHVYADFTRGACSSVPLPPFSAA